jgi:lipopolysaccharide/colanic/teichoic acid biosynthesis glycosyltransferase
VATSERVLTTMSSAAVTQHSSPHVGWSTTRNTVWRTVLADMATIVIAVSLVITISFRGLSSFQSQYSLLTVTVYALAAITILGFTGAYPRRCTPLNIAATEGLVKGACCLLVLMVIGGLTSRAVPGFPAFVIGASIGLLVLLRREVSIGWVAGNGARSWPTRQGLHSNTGATTGTLDDFDGSRVGALQEWVESPSGYWLKRTIDLTAAFILAFAAAPFLLVVAVLIKADSSGPVFVRQRRIGRYGTPFSMWKFRSMHQGVARYERSPVSTTDIRLTRVGRVIRRLSIDEVPQLLNVIQGDMSLVGPRPEMPFIVEQYGPFERLRLNAIPGITGLWQISPARAMPIHKNIELDLYYIQHRNMFLDIAILLRTATAVIRGIGAA